ncbi:hypothetical protein ACIQMV_19230 [Streptomyces sp. NPDC091412]|uniref:hypothetical protein n=1 Tax=Streptomyces sp. NPDC091412 TaxID=3366002 RepID=UPI0038106748
MPRRPGPAPVPPHEPSPELKAAIRDWEDSVKREQELRQAARKAVADELIRFPDLPVAALAKAPEVPWDVEMVRRIAREYDVPYRQPNKAPVKEE